MKYKIKHEKGNLFLMSSIFIMCIMTCGIWFMIKEYTYFYCYLIMTLLLAYFYFFTFYYLKNNYMVIQIGFIKIKFKYIKIRKIDNLQNSIKIKYNNMEVNIYPNNKDKFYSELVNKIGGKK